MIALGLYSGVNGKAAAVVRDGRVVTAVSALSNHTLNPDGLSLVTRCLSSADLDICHLDQVVSATDNARFQSGHDSLKVFLSAHDDTDRLNAIAERPLLHIGMDQAHLSQLRLLPVRHALGVVLSQHSGRGGATAHISEGRRSQAVSMSGAAAIASAIHAVAQALGYRGDEPVAALERLAHGGAHARPNTFERALSLPEDSDIAFDAAALHNVLECARQESPERLDQQTVHIEAIRIRRQLATGVLERCAELLSQTLGRLTPIETSVFAIGGDLFGSAAFARRIARRLENARFAPVCHDVGAALGAALEPFSEVEPLRDLALGSPFDEQDIKDVLENCRLVYMYEPNWAALASRVSHLLSGGALVGWFQGREAFGPDSLGSRSILCDPSAPYARENVNRFLLARDPRRAVSGNCFVSRRIA